MRHALGTCYYPEHWDEALWAEDAARMAEIGLSWVRIGEFAWSRIEPAPGRFDWDWLDRAVEVLAGAGLRLVMGTPSATPPRWMLERHPDMLAVDADGRVRGFGSRRHYCFSHAGYRAEAARIAGLMAERYGRHPALGAWQTDNEYGCHDTVLSYSDAARDAFRLWLERRYGDIATLNRAWGNVFWSMEYDSFDQIGLPNLTVTEANPSHWLAFRRFSSDQVVTFNRALADAIRAHSSAPICHNYMGRITDFDHFATGEDLDFASWDSYPLGFLEDRVGADDARKRAFMRQGDPDFQAFHHDLYRAVGKGRWWVMEQQPGPVNWAPYNPDPLPGMVRLWTWEAFAHGAEVVSYFRWRQAPFAQEQMHAGMNTPANDPAPASAEAAQVAAEIAATPELAQAACERAAVALIFDYEADWAWTIQPQGRGLSHFALVFDLYRACRRAGLSVDIVPPDGDLTGRRLVLAPGLMHIPAALKAALADCGAVVLAGPRSGASTGELTIDPAAPGLPGLQARVLRVESLRPDCPVPLQGGGAIVGWREFLETGAGVAMRDAEGWPMLVRAGALHYLAGWPDDAGADRVIAALCQRAGLEVMDLPDGLRCRDAGEWRFWFNYAAVPQPLPHATGDLRGHVLPPAGVAWERL